MASTPELVLMVGLVEMIRDEAGVEKSTLLAVVSSTLWLRDKIEWRSQALFK